MDIAKGIVFSTRNIQRRNPSFPGQEPTSRIIVPTTGEVVNYYTRGILEKAIDQGRPVYVVSTRPELGPHDEWWLRLAGLQNTFLAPPAPMPPEPPDEEEDLAEYNLAQQAWEAYRSDPYREDKRLFHPWRRLSMRLKTGFPAELTHYREGIEAVLADKLGLWSCTQFKKNEQKT